MGKVQKRIIHINWDGPKSLNEIEKFDGEEDYGVYQIYGNHPVYGTNSLIYIGMAPEQTFAKRIKQQDSSWLNDEDVQPISINVGRFEDDFRESEWTKIVGQVEQMLIYSHAPSYNSSNINKILGKELENIHILNWGVRGSLLPEVSGDRWSNKFEENET